MPTRRKPGRSLTDAERAATRERLTLRPRRGFLDSLDALRGDVPRTEALEQMVAWAAAKGWRPHAS